MDSSPREAAPRARAGAPRLAAALLAALAAAAVAGVGYLPTHDGPQHVFALHALNHLGAADTGWGLWLEPGHPLTSRGFAWIFRPLDAWLGWRPALRLSLAAMVSLWTLGALAFARAVHPGRAWLGVGLGAAACQWSLYMGFFSFYVASAFGLFVLAAAFGAPRWSGRRRAVLSALLLLQALMHVVPAALGGALLALLALARAARGERAREARRVALIGAPAALLTLALLWPGLAALAAYNQAAGGRSSVVPAGWWTLGRCFLGGPAWRAWPLTLLAAAAPAVALASGPQRLRPEDRALIAGGAALLAGAKLLPIDLPAWDFFSVRFLPLATCALVLALPFERLSGGVRRGAAAALCLFAAAATAWAAAYGAELARRAAPALAGLGAPLRAAGPRLPLVLDPYLGEPADERAAPMPYSVPLLNLGQLYAATQGGVVPDSFLGNPYIHAALLRPEAAAAFPASPPREVVAELSGAAGAGDQARRRAVLAWAASFGTDYHDVILWGRPADADALVALGFEPEWRAGGLLLARFRGCPLELRFPPGAPVNGSTVVELGWSPSREAIHRFAVGGAHRAADGSVSMPLRQSACGAVWLRLADGRHTCAGADADGRLWVASTRATPVVECRAEPLPLRAAR